jgi:hypothetical protein
MRINYLEAKTSLAPFWGNGVCSDNPDLALAINESIERLIDSGKWVGTVRKIAFCHTAGLLTMPRDVETILEASDCGAPISVNNMWFEYLSGGPFQLSQCNQGWPAMVERGDNYCTAFDITGNMLVRIYNDLSQDNGKAILLQGVNSDGNRVQTVNMGEVVDGEILIYNNATPPVTTVVWSNIEAIQKTLTTGPIRLYQVDPVTLENKGLLVILHPNDTIPSFRRYYYGACQNSICNGDGTSTPRYRPLTFLCKMRHTALVQDTDIVPITAAGAIKNMVMALWMERNNQLDMATQYETRAVQCLQNELKQSLGSQVKLNSRVPGFGNRAPAYSFY